MRQRCELQKLSNAVYADVTQGFFFVFSGAEIRPHSQLNLGDIFPNFDHKNLFF